jgi:hypothetical protein
LVSSLKDSSSFWSSESAESLQRKEESLGLLTERLEQHLNGWINDLDKTDQDLQKINQNVKSEFVKINELTKHFENISEK